MPENVYYDTGVKFPHWLLHEQGLPHVCDNGEVWHSPLEVAFWDALTARFRVEGEPQ
jgi:hypothetical protein